MTLLLRRARVKATPLDFTFAINGRAVAIEVKRPGEEPRPEQVRCLQGLVRDGWVIRVAFDVVDVVRVIKEVEAL